VGGFGVCVFPGFVCVRACVEKAKSMGAKISIPVSQENRVKGT
jgi:hypothetical protein